MAKGIVITPLYYCEIPALVFLPIYIRLFGIFLSERKFSNLSLSILKKEEIAMEKFHKTLIFKTMQKKEYHIHAHLHHGGCHRR